MTRLALLLTALALACAGIITAASAHDSGATAIAAKTPKLTKAQKKSKKKCLKKSYRHRYQLTKVVKKSGKKVGKYRCHRLTDAELIAEEDADRASGNTADPYDLGDDGEGDQPPVVLPSG